MRLAVVLLTAALALSACQKPATAPNQSAAAKVFMDKNATEPGVQTLPSGLQFKVVREGAKNGLRPKKGDEVKVHYEGKLVDGTVFDSSYARGQPAAMPLDALIPGWIEALQLMRPGDEWVLYVPPALGYGDREAGQIPPGSALIFRIELIDVLPGPGTIGQG